MVISKVNLLFRLIGVRYRDLKVRYSPKMGQSVHFIKDLGSGQEGGGASNIRSAPGGRYSGYATADV